MNRLTTFSVATGIVAAITAVASASVVDTVALQTPTALSFTDSQNALYSLTATQPAGSGVFDPFMRIQRTDDAQGYNSSMNNGPSATMDLINLPGNASSQLNFTNLLDVNNQLMLTLDYNEPGKAGTSTLFLKELILVVSTDPDKTGPAGPANKGAWSIQSIPMSAGDQVIYQMSAATDGGGNPYAIKLDADANSANGNGGSGAADLNVTFNFTGLAGLQSMLDGQHYLYVYSRFSGTEAGFEEWSAFHPLAAGGSPIPEPASLGVLALGAMGLMIRRRR